MNDNDIAGLVMAVARLMLALRQAEAERDAVATELAELKEQAIGLRPVGGES